MTWPKVSLNLGSGQRPFSAPFVNIDVQAKWNPDIVHDVSSLPMFEDGSVDMVVLHMVYEHFGCGEGACMIRESYRVLRAGSSLIVIVPNAKELARRYADDIIEDFEYAIHTHGAYMGDDADRHKWCYSRRSLVEALMQCAPWMKATDFDWRAIEGADIAAWSWWMLGIEVIK